MTEKLYLDLESFSEVDLFKHGTHRYADSPTTRITVLGWAFGDAPAQVVDLTAPGAEMPAEVVEELALGDRILVAHNSAFDRTVLAAKGYPTPIARWHDTMVKAYAHSLPGGLGKLGPILGLPADEHKDARGKELVRMFCKPQSKTFKVRIRNRDTNPVEWALFVDYCRQDVEAMRAIDRALPSWNYGGAGAAAQRETALWHLDQTINARGFAVDTELAQAAIRASDEAKESLDEEIGDLTLGDVSSATKRDQLLKYIVEAYGVKLPDMKADTLRRRVEDPELPDAVRQMLRVRLEASMTTRSKYSVLLRAVSDDGRLRNTLQFAGAMRTARWSGRMFQPHNMMRPNLKQWEIEVGIDAMKAGCESLVTDNVMRLAANCARGSIVAPPGRKLVISDLSNIEGRGLAWLAGEQWKIKAFADFDAGIGHDLYKVAYARSFNVDPATVGSGDDRQIGKVQELALGYEGGVAAFIAFAMVYHIDLDKMANAVLDTLPGVVLHESERFWEWAVKKQRTYGLPRHVFVACEALKRLWREAHPATVAFWADLADAVRSAIKNPGIGFHAGEHILARRDGVWLRIRLPSGRCLCYVKPQVGDKGQISYLGVNQYTKQWTRISTHGGKLAENVDQAMSRDVLAWNMPAIEERGYKIVTTIHDEIISETPDTAYFTASELSQLMATNPPWAEGLPLAAKGFEAYRYRKD